MANGKRHGLILRRGCYGFRYKNEADEWREKSCGTSNFDEAKRVKDEFEQNLKDGTLPTEKADWTIEQAATLWVEQHAARLGPAKSKRNELSLLRQLVQRLGSRKLKAITLDTIKTYQARRSERVAPRTINLELRILVNVLKDANLWKRFENHYKPLKEQESDVGDRLTTAELTRLEATAASEPAWEVAYRCEVLAANTGMRGGEIKRLLLADVNLELRRLRIRRQGTKTPAGARLVELNQAALEATTRLYERAQMLGASKPEHYLLPADRARHTYKFDPLAGGIGFDPRHHQTSWRTAWRSLRKAAGLDGLRFHDLRHTFITIMAESNVPLPVVQAMVGHMSAAVTRHYTHISTKAARQAVELLDKPSFVDKSVDRLWDAVNIDRKFLN